MKFCILPSFWEAYRKLAPEHRRAARKCYRLWSASPFHPSLRFKCVNKQEGVWSVRVTLGCRAVAIVDGETATWFWIGDHDAYEAFFG